MTTLAGNKESYKILKKKKERKEKESQEHMVELIGKVKERIDYLKLGAWGKKAGRHIGLAESEKCRVLLAVPD